MMTIYDLTSRIRELINAARQQTLLLKDRDSWLKLCSSLDALGDTDLALDAYIEESFPSSSGALYILVYGVLQVLYVQQNAASDLLDALDITKKYGDYPRLSRIRDIRSASIGHPTRKKSKGGYTYHFITRVSLSKSGFMLLSNRPDGSTNWEPVAIPDLIAHQREDVADILGKVIQELEAREERHREEFREEKLEAVLPHTLSYHFQKINEVTGGKTSAAGAALGLPNVHMIQEAVKRFRDALSRRGLDEAWHIEEILYPLNEIEAFFEAIRQGNQPPINERLAYYCSFFAEHRVEGLRQTAREIDEEYGKSVRQAKKRRRK